MTSGIGLTSDNWITSPTGAVVSLAVALSGLVRTVALFWLQRRSRLDWAYRQDLSLLSTREVESVVPGFEMSWDEGLLEQPTIVTVRVCNMGSATIRGSHFENGDPAQLAWSEGKALYVNVAGESRAGVVDQASLYIGSSQSSIEFLPGLMKHGEWFDLRVLLDGATNPPSLSAVFEGQTRDPVLHSFYQSFAVRRLRVLKSVAWLATALSVGFVVYARKYHVYQVPVAELALATFTVAVLTWILIDFLGSRPFRSEDSWRNL